MKRVILMFAVCIAWLSYGFAQCTPNSPTGTPGLTPTPDNVTCIERGVFYDFTLQFENFSSLSCGGIPVTITSASIDNITNLPCGITWQADQSSYAGGATGCIRLSGTTTDPVGQYLLTVFMTFQLDIFGTPATVNGSIPQLEQQLQQFGCPATGIDPNYYARIYETGTSCPAIDRSPGAINLTSSGATCPPAIAVIISGNTTICSGSSTTLTANVTNSTGSVNYAWSSGGSSQDITVSPTSSMTYSVTVTDQNGSATTSTTVTVNPLPVAAFTASASGASATVNNTSTNATTWLWDFGDNTTSTAENPVAHTYSSNGTYTITLIVTNSCGTNTATQQVTITGVASLSVTISGNTTICEGSSTMLMADPSNATGSVTYSWSPGGGNMQSISVSPTANTTYSVTATDQNGSATSSATVTVDPLPNAAFTASISGATATISNTTTDATSYMWDFGDSQTSTMQNPPAHTYSTNGNFTITLVATNSCGSSTASQVVNVTGVGIADVAIPSTTLKIYPNPFHSFTTVELENITGLYDFAIYTITGRKVLQQRDLSNPRFLIEKDGLSQGVYVIEVSSEKMLIRNKIIVY